MSPYIKNHNPNPWEPSRREEESFGYRKRNKSRSDSKIGVSNIESLRDRSPEFYNGDRDYVKPP